MIKNIVFDVGNVLAEYRWKEYIAELGYSGELAERLARATALNTDWQEMDRGVLTVDEVTELMAEKDPEIRDEVKRYVDNRFNGMVVAYDYAAPLLKSLKERDYGIYILSNFSDDHFADLEKKSEFMQYSDGKIISARVKCIKPDEKIYHILFDTYGLEPSECVFLDDSERNIRTAERLGMKGIVFKGYEDGVGQLEKLLSTDK